MAQAGFPDLDVFAAAGIADFVMFDRSGTITSVSTSLLRGIGVGDNVFDKLPVLHGCDDLFDENADAHYPISFEGVTLTAQGHDQAFDFHLGRNVDGQNGLLIVAPNRGHDGPTADRLRERRKAQYLEELLEQERIRFDHVFRHAPVCAFATGPAGEVIATSAALETWLGPAVDIVAWIADFVALYRDRWPSPAGDQPRTAQFRTGVSIDAHRVVIADVSVLALRSVRGIEETFVSLQDVTLVTALTATLRRQRDALQLAKSDLERSNRRLEQFAHVAAHDLLGPLGRMASFSEIVEREVDPAADGILAFAVDAIRQSARSSIGLVRDLLALARLDEAAPEWERVDPDAVARHIAGQLWEDGQVELSTDGAVSIVADRRLFEVILRNVLANSYKYRDRARPLAVHLKFVCGGDGMAELAIADNGMGFDADAGDPFAAFQRMDGSSGIEGVGLGLSMVRDAAEAMGWSAGISARRGEGTTLHFGGIRLYRS